MGAWREWAISPSGRFRARRCLNRREPRDSVDPRVLARPAIVSTPRSDHTMHPRSRSRRRAPPDPRKHELHACDEQDEPNRCHQSGQRRSDRCDELLVEGLKFVTRFRSTLPAGRARCRCVRRATRRVELTEQPVNLGGCCFVRYAVGQPSDRGNPGLPRSQRVRDPELRLWIGKLKTLRHDADY
jgi:hypothetical protein